MWRWTIAMLCLGVASAAWADERSLPAMTLRGRVVAVAAIGGETTGWALELESDLTLDGKSVRRIEVSPAPKIERLNGQRVEATGVLTWRRGVERGSYPLLEIDTVRALGP